MQLGRLYRKWSLWQISTVIVIHYCYLHNFLPSLLVFDHNREEAFANPLTMYSTFPIISFPLGENCFCWTAFFDTGSF